MLSTLIPYLLTLIPFVIVLVVMLVHASKRSVGAQIVRTATHLVSILASLFLAPIVSKAIVASVDQSLLDVVKNLANGISIPDETGLSSFVVALISPFVFFLLWFVIGLILLIVYEIFKKALNGDLSKRSGGAKAVSMVLAGVTAVATTATFLMPSVGTVRMAAQSEQAIEKIAKLDDEWVDDANEYLNEMYENPVYKGVDFMTGWMYDHLLTIEYLGDKGCVSKDLPEILNEVAPCIDALMQFGQMTDMNNLADADLSFLSTFATTIGKTGTGRIVGCSLMRAVTASVGNMKDKDPEGQMNDLYDIIIKNFADCTPQNVASDIENFYQAIVSLQKTMGALNEMQKEDAKPEEVVAKTEEIFENITPESAQIAADVITTVIGSTNIGGGSSEGETKIDIDAVGGTIGNVFVAMSEAKDTMTEEEYREEVKVFTNVMDFTVNPTQDKADQLIQNISNSDVISSVLEQAVTEKGNDPFGIGATLSESDKNNIASYVQDQKDLGGDQAKLDMILQLLGVQG